MIIITLDCNDTFIVNVFGGKNECDLDFKFDSKRNLKIIVIVIPVYFIYLRIISRIVHYGHFRGCHTFLDSIFAVYRIALCPVRILTGMCFVGTPPPPQRGF